jgi:Flp pilus assembly pilin Flp
MSIIGTYYQRARHIAEYYLTRLGRDARDETGALSTEAVVLAAVFVAAAVTAGVLFKDKVTAIVEGIPESGFGD